MQKFVDVTRLLILSILLICPSIEPCNADLSGYEADKESEEQEKVRNKGLTGDYSVDAQQGRMYFNLENYSQAIPYLERAVKSKRYRMPKLGVLMKRLGKSYMMAGRIEKGCSMYEAVMAKSLGRGAIVRDWFGEDGF